MTTIDNVTEEQFYDRQMRIWGKKGQQMISNARVSVVGLDKQGQYSALCLAALGIGNLVLVDGETASNKDTFLDMQFKKDIRAPQLAEFLSKINPGIQIEAYPINIYTDVDTEALTGSTVVVDATNSISSKHLTAGYCAQHKAPFLSTSSAWGYTKLSPAMPNQEHLMPMFEGLAQDPLMSLVMCGVVAEEVRKFIFGANLEYLDEPVKVSLGNDYLFRHPADISKIPKLRPKDLSTKSVAFLGAGAIGTWAAIAASHIGFGRADFYDYDTFDVTNLHRQVLAYDGADRPKASHVSKKLIAMTEKNTKSTAYNMKIEPGFTPRRNYDLLLDLVDNPYTRANNCAAAINTDTPMVSSAALPYAARSNAQVPGKTQCTDCIHDIYARGRHDEMIRRASCALNPDPSVVMSNAIAGGLAIIQALTVLLPKRFGDPHNGELTYRSTGKRFGTSTLGEPCSCYSRPAPDLTISDNEVAQFVAANPQLARE